MSTTSRAVRVSAAAIALGVSLGVPAVVCESVGVASADASDTAGAASPDSGAAPRTARGPRAALQSKTSTPAAARRSARPDPSAAAADEPRPRRGGLNPTSAAVAQPAAAVAVSVGSPTPVPDPLASLSPRTVPALVADAPAPAAATRAAIDPGLRAAASSSAAAPATAAPTALGTVGSPAAARASSTAGVLGGLLAPLKSLFEGAGLLVRRALFNDPPTVNPVQLTGQGSGPITGTIGAIDPEGDPLNYSVTGTPRYGSVSIGQDGSYTYTPGEGFAGSDSFVVAVTDTGSHLNLRNLKRPKSVSVSVAVAQGALAPALNFQFIYGAGAQYWSSQARAALETAARQLSSYFVVSSPVTITYNVTGQRAALSSTLASAGSDLVDTTGFSRTIVQAKIQTGIDPNGSAADGDISWNFGPSWALGDTVGSNQYDFQSTAMHELLHTFGFLSNVTKPGTNTGQTWTLFDSFLVDSTGAAVIGGDYTWNTADNPALTGSNGGLFFGGPNAVAAYLSPVPVYTPSPWSSGSSISHLSDNVFTGVNEQLMNAVTSHGKGVRVLSPVELGILTDLGYHVTPGAPTLMFVGFFILRARRRKD